MKLSPGKWFNPLAKVRNLEGWPFFFFLLRFLIASTTDWLSSVSRRQSEKWLLIGCGTLRNFSFEWSYKLRTPDRNWSNGIRVAETRRYLQTTRTKIMRCGILWKLSRASYKVLSVSLIVIAFLQTRELFAGQIIWNCAIWDNSWRFELRFLSLQEESLSNSFQFFPNLSQYLIYRTPHFIKLNEQFLQQIL